MDVGTSSGGSDFSVITTGSPNRTLNLPNLPEGRTIYIRLRAQRDGTSGTSPTSEELRFFMQDYKGIVEALFLGTGPYASRGVPPGDDVVRGWPPGTTVRIRVSDSLTPAQRRGIENVAAQLAQSGAPYRATLESMPGNQSFIIRNELPVITQAGACQTGLGCASFADNRLSESSQLPKVFSWSGVFLGTASEGGNNLWVAAHELTHALFGLYHVGYVDVPEWLFTGPWGNPSRPKMTMWPFLDANNDIDRVSDLELQILQEVYRAGIVAGSPRSALQARGLIH